MTYQTPDQIASLLTEILITPSNEVINDRFNPTKVVSEAPCGTKCGKGCGGGCGTSV